MGFSNQWSVVEDQRIPRNDAISVRQRGHVDGDGRVSTAATQSWQ